MDDLPSTYPHPIHLAIIGGTGLGSLPDPPFTRVAFIPPFKTPWGLPSSGITVLQYTPSHAHSANAAGNHVVNGASHVNGTAKPLTVAFLARHGHGHHIAPHEINNRANVAALKKLGVRSVIGFSAVGSLREEVRPRDFCVAGSVIDWTKGVRPWTFFERGVVGHVSMADPFDSPLSDKVYQVITRPGVLESTAGGAPGETPRGHNRSTIVCIEGPQFVTRAESHMFRGFATKPPVSCINMSAVPECKLFREAEIAYALVCMSTDYDSWHDSREGVSVEMVMLHMAANAANAKRVIGAVLQELAKEESRDVVMAERWQGQSRNSVMGLESNAHAEKDVAAKVADAVDKMTWLFGEAWVKR